MGEVDVRDAGSDDAPAIGRIYKRAWQVAYAHIFPAERLAGISEEQRAESWRGAIESRAPRAHTLVATREEGISGFAALGSVRPFLGSTGDEGELYAIYVLPERWGRGTGTTLMAAVLERLRPEDFGDAVLWVLEDNPRARRFYELAGWHLDGGVKEENILDTEVRELRYRIRLDRLA